MKLFIWVVFCICRFIFGIAQRLWWRITGTATTLRQIQAGQLYEKSAHVRNIVWKCKWDDLSPSEPSKFITTHSHFDHPRCILGDDVTLMFLDENEAYFAQTPLSVNIFSSDLSPFLYTALFNHVYRLIVMPISSFHRIADEIGDPKTKVLLLSNTGRCGSTAVTQVLESVPRVVSMSEPDGFTNIIMLRKKLSNEDLEKFIQSMIRITCKPLKSNPQLICIKTKSMDFNHADIDARLFPDMKHLFLYRNGKETIQSFYHAFGFLPIAKLFHGMQTSRLAHRLFPNQAKFFWSMLMVPDLPWLQDPELMIKTTMVGMMACHWAVQCHTYIRFKEAGMDIKAFKYEDILENPQHACERLLEYCGLPLEYTEIACNALKHDSQRGMLRSRKDTKDKDSKYLIKWNNPDVLAEVNFFCDQVGITRIGEPTLLPDTISSLSS
ncbi:uncharacterized protein LOC106181336 [Lingula anatina]|uniref:Uncharacterized protein LOC106181336 n=1 Tax=Lingula anatina TaxID=7574 RepID=A0A1S3KF83_LINAN|nr:uncharacterized protein LOC106181336 [Lingula anatina]|eukprot:XP_013421147.1 uncharacterized protein LOC106181336 [Lingula anatina]